MDEKYCHWCHVWSDDLLWGWLCRKCHADWLRRRQ